MHFVNAKTILGKYGINIYRGCTHGCIYCDSRSKCYQFTHAFEDVEVKQNAPELLEEALRKKRKRCMIGTGSMCDPYIPAEKELKLTRRCLEIIDKYDFGAALITKSDLVLRDIDLLSRINRKTKAVVQMTLTTAEDELCRKLEPGVCPTSRRFEVLKAIGQEGIPTVVWLSPFLPFINDTRENIEGLLDYCVQAGVKAIVCFGIGLTLREGNREYFYDALDRIFPGQNSLPSQKLCGHETSNFFSLSQDNAFSLSQDRASALQLAGTQSLKQLYIKTFGNCYSVSSPRHNQLMQLISKRCKENNIMLGVEKVFNWMQEFPEGEPGQLELF